MSSDGKLYLIPNTLGGEEVDSVIPSGIGKLIRQVDVIFVEHEKAARKLLILVGQKDRLNDIELISIKQGLQQADREYFRKEIKSGKNFAILSDAGCPAVADPGFDIVALAHEMGIHVLPLVGPSSILLALMASGFNGQNFAFHGYLPKEQLKRRKKILDLERSMIKNSQTQIFIETPYRNQYLFADLLSSCQKNTKICLALNLTMPDEWIRVKTIDNWRKSKPDLNKKPCIFLIYK